MAGNDLLVAVSVLERAVDALKIDSRQQLNRNALDVCKSCCELCATKLANVGFSDTYTLGRILDSLDLINGLLELDNFVETDTETKELLNRNLGQALETLYVKVGVYYDTHEFELNRMLEPLLARIVDKCIINGFFFGVEKEV